MVVRDWENLRLKCGEVKEGGYCRIGVGGSGYKRNVWSRS